MFCFARIFTLVLLVSFLACAAVWAGPVADLAALGMNDGSGLSVYDTSAASNDGQLVGGATWTTTGKIGGGIYLDGNSKSSIDLGNSTSLALTNAVTGELWFNPARTTNTQVLIQRGRDWWAGYELYLEGNQLKAVINGTKGQDNVSAGVVMTNQWQHGLFTYQSGVGGAVYLNGVATALPDVGDIKWVSTDPSNTGDFTNNNLYLGQHVWDIYNFQGSIDEAAVYSRALTSTEVAQRYNSGIGVPVQPLRTAQALQPRADVIALHLNEGSGTVAYDAGSGGHNATLNGGATWGQGVSGGAVHFDGITGNLHASLPASQSPTTGLTVEGWFYVDQNPDVDGNNNWRWIFNKGGWGSPFDCILEESRQLGFSIVVDGTQYRWWSGQSLPLDAWAHVAWTYDGATGMMKEYVNGVEADHFIGTTGNLSTNDSDVFFSWASVAAPDGSGSFPGWMDELAIYSHALTSTEVFARYQDGPPQAIPEPSTLVCLLGLGIAWLAVWGWRCRRSYRALEK